MSANYFSGQVRGLRGPGLTAEQTADVAGAVEGVEGLQAQQVARTTYETDTAFIAATADGDYGYVGSTLKRNDAGVATTAAADELAQLGSYTVLTGGRGLVIDEYSKKLLVPAFYVKTDRLSAPALISPASGLYTEVDAGDLPAPSEVPKFAYYNLTTGAFSDGAFTTGSNALAPRNRITLAVSYGGTISSALGVAEVKPNLISRGSFDRQLTTSSSSYLAPVTETTLNALGITEMVFASDGNPQAAARVPADLALNNGHVFVRCFVQLGPGEAAGSFPASLQARVIKRDVASATGPGNLLGASMLLEKVYGDRIASYVASNTRIVASWALGAVRVGVYGEAASRDIRISLPQVAIGQRGDMFVQPTDWPARTSEVADEPYVYYPETLSKIEGRALPIYAIGVAGNYGAITPGGLVSLACENSTNANNGSAPAPISLAFSDQARIDNLNDGFEARLMLVEPRPWASRRAVMYATTRVAGASDIAALGSLAIAFIGDSITDVYPTAARTGGVLLNAGVSAVSYVGTMYAGQPREGRSGRPLSDYVYKATTLTPVDPGGEAAYLALSDTDKKAYNPMIRAEVGTEPGAFNGYIFDYGDYLSRFGLATPTHVVVNLGTNDATLFDDPELLYAHMVECLGSMVPSILAADPGIKVVLAMGGEQWHTYAVERRWRKRYKGVIRAILAYVRSLASSRVIVAPAWAHMSPYDWSDNTITTERVDTDTGLRFREMGDDVHFNDTALREYCECVAAAVANV